MMMDLTVSSTFKSMQVRLVHSGAAAKPAAPQDQDGHMLTKINTQK